MQRADFDYTAECGYYECPVCNTPYYPMEVIDEEYCMEENCIASQCGDKLQYKNQNRT